MTDFTTDLEDTIEAYEDQLDSGTLEVLPPARLPDMAAITTLREHVGAMRDAKFFAEGMCYSALVPDRFRGKPGDGAAAILFGAEIGLSPIASLRSVIVIHGQPGLEARTMKAILKAKGYKFKTHEISDTACDIEAWSPDGSESERCRFTMEDAIKAQYVPVEIEGKPGEYKKNSNNKLQGNMKYITEPKNMLRAKATAVVCREIAPHILLGMPFSSDELDTEDWSQPPASQTQRRPRSGVAGVRAARERKQAAQQATEEPVDAEIVPDDPQPAAEEVPAAQPTNVRPSEEMAELRKSARTRLNSAIFATFGELGLNGDDKRADRLIVIREIVGREIGSSKELTDDELQQLRNGLISRKQAGTLDSDVTEWLNLETLRQDAATADESPAETAE
ncbi:hypothetical protein A5722_14850 [Mycobacterium vulneris]|nr:hypothetical protein A5722_14850 [Mycolicibacterium vulneris]OCB66207.1 hypothetical protein A5729_12355 [Mycolicibacterium vulneris]